MIYIEIIKFNFFTVTYSVKINYTGYTFTITILKFSFFQKQEKYFLTLLPIRVSQLMKLTKKRLKTSALW